MDVDEEYVAVAVDQLDRLVRAPVLVDLDQTAEPPHAVIDMHHVIARFELVQLGDGHLLVAPDLAVDAVTLVAVENLVVGITAETERMVDEPLVQRERHRREDHPAAADLVENILQAFDLGLVLR